MAYVIGEFKHQLWLADVVGGERRLLYESGLAKEGTRRPIMFISFSPDSTWVTFLEFQGHEPENYLGTDCLRWISVSSGKQGEMQDTFDCAWCPDATRFAYITGVAQETVDPCLSNGLWIYDLESGTSKKIRSSATQIAWAAFDGNLYFMDEQTEGMGNTVFKYDDTKGETSSTEYRGILFSPTGKYYVVETGDGPAPLAIISRRENKETTSLGAKPFSRGLASRLIPVAWLDNQRLYCYSIECVSKKDGCDNVFDAMTGKSIETNYRSWYIVLDVETGKLWRTKDRVLRLLPGDTLIVQTGATDFAKIPLKGLEVSAETIETQPNEPPPRKASE